MKCLNSLYYYTWNIGFVEKNISDIILDDNSRLNVKWVNHNYQDRFFADPFILDSNENEIKVLVEEYPYFRKKGIISLLIVDRKNLNLLSRKVVLEQPFHMSYPYIQRDCNDISWIAPEASMSGCLYRYKMNPKSHVLEDQKLLLNEPVLDSTIIEYNEMFWLFCTKRGEDSNKKLYIYYSNSPEGPWTSHIKNPVINDGTIARPAGYMVKVNNVIYRIVQKNDNSYGEAINITKIKELSTTDFKETFFKQLKSTDDAYSHGFHTINGYGNICVVDGLRKDFMPFRRIWFEIRNKLKI